MTSLILIGAFLSIPMFLSFLALKEMSQMQESELVVRDSSGGTVQLRFVRSTARANV
jgi:hypothetical protein